MAATHRPTAPPRNNTTYELVHRLATGSIPPADIPRVLTRVFDASDYKSSLRYLPNPYLEMWVDFLDQTIDSEIYGKHFRKRALRSLGKTCGSRKILPFSNLHLNGLFEASNTPARGGTADVWRVTNGPDRNFAAKVFRTKGEYRKIKKYYKELVVWKRLNHPNVVPILGARPDFAPLCAVSPWMPGGDVLEYLGEHPGVNRVAIMIGVADGLSYLHFNDVVHGDLKGGNILFDSGGIPRILGTSTSRHDFNARWAAPEGLDDSRGEDARRPTKMSDVYSFGMVVVEIFSGKLPFPDISDLNVRLMVAKGKRPSKPVNASSLGLSSKAWKLVEDCWNKRREKRPEIQSKPAAALGRDMYLNITCG